MAWAVRRRRFREILRGTGCVHPASVYDPISARIAESLGFEIGMFAGSTASLTVLGAPDLVLLTLTEFAEQARRICRASELPLLVDADHGYGNALNVRRTVEEIEAVGVSGVTIEDTALPLQFGKSGEAGLVSLEEGVGKIRAALSARRDPDLSIVARTSALYVSSLEDAVMRLRAYQEAGADALFVPSIRTRAHLESLSETLRLPLIVGSAAPDLADTALLARYRVRICLQGHLPCIAAIQTVYDTMKALRDGKAPSTLDPTGRARDLVERFSRKVDYARDLAEFLETRCADRRSLPTI